jgi:Signal transduction histidine kinase
MQREPVFQYRGQHHHQQPRNTFHHNQQIIGFGTQRFVSALSAWFGRILLKPVNQVINAMNALADGKFSTRLTFSSWFGHQSARRELSESFNKMAEELENTEMLRSDFINHFSHEFKTPIVSIAGFASLLLRGNLDEKQKQEYLAAIEEESMRLSDLATNVLNLSKIENQTILGDKTRFNLSEQIRSCILLFERKWNEKKLDLIPDFDEYEITADREMLMQVWINLLDKAVKFTPEYGLIKNTIRSRADDIVVSFTNTGSSIPEDKKERIFQKFYQADESHATKDNGVGLAIVKKVVELHHGEVSVTGDENSATFTVILPGSEKNAAA